MPKQVELVFNSLKNVVVQIDKNQVEVTFVFSGRYITNRCIRKLEFRYNFLYMNTDGYKSKLKHCFSVLMIGYMRTEKCKTKQKFALSRHFFPVKL